MVEGRPVTPPIAGIALDSILQLELEFRCL